MSTLVNTSDKEETNNIICVKNNNQDVLLDNSDNTDTEKGSTTTTDAQFDIDSKKEPYKNTDSEPNSNLNLEERSLNMVTDSNFSLLLPKDFVNDKGSSKKSLNMPTLTFSEDEVTNIFCDQNHLRNTLTDTNSNISTLENTNSDPKSEHQSEKNELDMLTVNKPESNLILKSTNEQDIVKQVSKGTNDSQRVINMTTLGENEEFSTESMPNEPSNEHKLVNMSKLTSISNLGEINESLSEESISQNVPSATDTNEILLEENVSNDNNSEDLLDLISHNTTNESNSHLLLEAVHDILSDADILNTSSDIDNEEIWHKLTGGKMINSEQILEAVNDLLGEHQHVSTDSNLNLGPQTKPDILSQATSDLMLSDLLDEFIELQPVSMTTPEEPAKTPEAEKCDQTFKIDIQTLPITFVQSKSNEPLTIYYIQPLGPDPLQTEAMSLSTLLEAARFLEMQEQQQSRAQQAQMSGHLTTTIVEAQGVVRPHNGVQNLHSGHLIQQSQPVYQNGNGLQTRTITLQPIKTESGVTVALNTPIASPVIQQSHTIMSQNGAPATQTVVISSNNISSTLLQGPISFPQSSSPAATSSSPITAAAVSIPATLKIDTDGHIKIEQDRHISSTTVQSSGPQPGHHVAVGQQQRSNATAQQQQSRTYNNSFDIVNPLVIDEGKPDQKSVHKLKQPPMAFRSGTREVHNKLEKHRRAHLKECFDMLKKQLMPNSEEKKTSNLSILHSALRCIQGLKRRERELDHEMERLAREKIAHQQRLAVLKKDISLHYDNVDFGKLLPEVVPSSSTLSDLVSSSSAILPQPIPEPVEVTVKTTNLPTVIASNNANGNGLLTATTNGNEKVAIPILSKPVSLVTQNAPVSAVKEVTGAQSVQTAGISVLPMSYPVNPQGLVLQKVAIVPHTGLKELTPLVSTHFITSPQQLNGINGQINGKMVPITQYLVKPVVVVSTPSPRPGS